MRMEPLLHELQFAFAHKIRILRASVHVERHDVGTLQKFLKRIALVRVAHGELRDDIVETDLHA